MKTVLTTNDIYLTINCKSERFTYKKRCKAVKRMSDVPFFSIVMPVYGVEKYLKAAIDSILVQTYSDFELILVDDCSPDSSGRICDEYACSNEKIKVVHLKENGGLSNARNTGFEICQGKYVFFMDSDDKIETDLLETVYMSVSSENVDMTVFGLVEEYFDNAGVVLSNIISYGKSLTLTSKDKILESSIELEKLTLLGYAWNKIYKADFLRANSIVFHQVRLIEDIVYNIEVLEHINSMSIIEKPLYRYAKRANQSITNQFIPEYFELNRKRVELLFDLYSSFGAMTDVAKKVLADIYARYAFSAIQRNCDSRSNMSRNEKRQFVESIFKDKLWCELRVYASKSSLQGILSTFLAKEKTFLCLFAGRFIFFVKTKLPNIFVKLK